MFLARPFFSKKLFNVGPLDTNASGAMARASFGECATMYPFLGRKLRLPLITIFLIGNSSSDWENSLPYCWTASYVFRPIINVPYFRQRLRKLGHNSSGIKSSPPSCLAINPSDEITLYKVSIAG